MKKKINYLIMFIIILFTLFNYSIITSSIKQAFNICINYLLPSIIPFLLLSNIIVRRNLLLNNTYTLNLLCFISGSPSNSKYIKEYLNSNIINTSDAQKLLNYLQYVNPLYILNVIGLVILNNKKLGLIVLLSNLISSIIIKPKNIRFNTQKLPRYTWSNTISYSIKDTINVVLYIIGVITFFFLLTSYIDILFNINEEYKFMYGILEITQGINYLEKSSLNIYLKTIISSFLVSFGGLSMHLQIFGILDNKKIRYKPYLINRIIHSILSLTITTLLFHILN